MLINLSNHPFEDWDKKQKEVALSKYGAVEDLPFPEVDPAADTQSVAQLAAQYLTMSVVKFGKLVQTTDAVHISGEPCFLYHFVNLSKDHGITCICSTTHRLVSNEGNIKTTFFQFVQFRKY